MNDITYTAPDWKSPAVYRRVVALMTNWENTVWSRAKYPGLKEKDATPIIKMHPRIARYMTGFVTTLSEPFRIAP